jgi:hypothetical protein
MYSKFIKLINSYISTPQIAFKNKNIKLPRLIRMKDL